MNSLEQLDEILKFLSTIPEKKDGITDREIYLLYNKASTTIYEEGNPNEKRKISLERIRKILPKLKDNKYIHILRTNSSGFYEYTITFEGDVFIEQGGYVEQERKSNAERLRLENMETNLLYVQVILAVGTSVLLDQRNPVVLFLSLSLTLENLLSAALL